MMERVCLCLSRFERGGIGEVVYDVSQALRDFYDVTIMCNYASRESPEGVKLSEVQGNSIEMILRPFKSRQEFDLFHAQDHLFLNSILQEKRSGSIYTHHGFLPLELRDSLREKIMSLVIREVYQRCIPKIDLSIAISECTKLELLEAKAKDIRVIPHGIDLETFKRISKKDTESLRVGDPMLLYVGSFSRFKGIAELLEYFRSVVEEFPKARLVLSGYGDLAFVGQHLTRLGLNSLVHLVDFQPRERLIKYYNACDVFVTASKYESFCLPMIEAMACGRPGIGVDAYATKEHISNSRAGETFNDKMTFLNALKTVLSDMNSYARRAVKYASMFSLKRQVSSLRNAYGFVLDQRD